MLPSSYVIRFAFAPTVFSPFAGGFPSASASSAEQQTWAMRLRSAALVAMAGGPAGVCVRACGRADVLVGASARLPPAPHLFVCLSHDACAAACRAACSRGELLRPRPPPAGLFHGEAFARVWWSATAAAHTTDHDGRVRAHAKGEEGEDEGRAAPGRPDR